MVAIQSLLPQPVPIHHLGLFREPTTFSPVEYYNNLPYHRPSSPPSASSIPPLAVILDPMIATGGTCEAAIQTLLEWGVQKVVVIAVLGSEEGLRKAAAVSEGAEQLEIWVGEMDIGDRLFLTVGK